MHAVPSVLNLDKTSSENLRILISVLLHVYIVKLQKKRQIMITLGFMACLKMLLNYLTILVILFHSLCVS